MLDNQTTVVKASSNLQVPGRWLDLHTVLEGNPLEGEVPGSLKSDSSGKRFLYSKVDRETKKSDLWIFQNSKHSMLVEASELVSDDDEKNLTEEEKQRREAARSWGSGIHQFSWCNNDSAVFIPLPGGNCHICHIEPKQIDRYFCGDGAIEMSLSPLNNYISYIKDNNLFYMDIKSKKTTQISVDGNENIKNGLAEYIAQEEMDRYDGYWWNEDESMIAFIKYDDSGVDTVTRIDVDAEGQITTIDFKYPKVGRPNVVVSLHIYHIKSKIIHHIPTNDLNTQDIYIPRVKWYTSSMLGYMIQSRDQKSLLIRRAIYDQDDQSFDISRDLTQKSENYINLPYDNDFGYLAYSDYRVTSEFIYITEENSSLKYITIYKITDAGLKPVTQPPFVKPTSVTIDKCLSAKLTYDGNIAKFSFIFNGRYITSPHETQVFKLIESGAGVARKVIKLFPSNPGSSGTATQCDKHGNVFSINSSSVVQPPEVSIFQDDASSIRTSTLFPNEVVAGHPFSPFIKNWIVPAFGTIKADDGKDLRFRLWRPFDLNDEEAKKKKYPVLVYVYGGPHAQMCRNMWSKNDVFLQYFAQNGYVVFQLDNRGAYGYGKGFEQVMFKRMSCPEIEDQKAGVDFLRSLPYVEAQKIGVYGHSYGGYMSLMLLFRAGSHFNTAVAGAPVIDWRLYDTHYTERYMETPVTNKEGYHTGNVLTHVSKFDDSKQNLLVYHGTSDNNVLFENTVKLYKELQNCNKLYESLDYPGIKHSMQGTGVKRHYLRSIIDFFDRKLKHNLA